MPRKDLTEGAAILGTAQRQHLVAIELIPPGSRALEPYMADELVGRFDGVQLFSIPSMDWEECWCHQHLGPIPPVRGASRDAGKPDYDE